MPRKRSTSQSNDSNTGYAEWRELNEKSPHSSSTHDKVVLVSEKSELDGQVTSDPQRSEANNNRHVKESLNDATIEDTRRLKSTSSQNLKRGEEESSRDFSQQSQHLSQIAFPSTNDSNVDVQQSQQCKNSVDNNSSSDGEASILADYIALKLTVAELRSELQVAQTRVEHYTPQQQQQQQLRSDSDRDEEIRRLRKRNAELESENSMLRELARVGSGGSCSTDESTADQSSKEQPTFERSQGKNGWARAPSKATQPRSNWGASLWGRNPQQSSSEHHVNVFSAREGQSARHPPKCFFKEKQHQLKKHQMTSLIETGDNTQSVQVKQQQQNHQNQQVPKSNADGTKIQTRFVQFSDTPDGATSNYNDSNFRCSDLSTDDYTATAAASRVREFKVGGSLWKRHSPQTKDTFKKQTSDVNKEQQQQPEQNLQLHGTAPKGATHQCSESSNWAESGIVDSDDDGSESREIWRYSLFTDAASQIAKQKKPIKLEVND